MPDSVDSLLSLIHPPATTRRRDYMVLDEATAALLVNAVLSCRPKWQAALLLDIPYEEVSDGRTPPPLLCPSSALQMPLRRMWLSELLLAAWTLNDLGVLATLMSIPMSDRRLSKAGSAHPWRSRD